MSSSQKKLLAIFLEVSSATKSDELIYVSEWLFDWPGQSLELGGVLLHKEYKLPDYNRKDLTALEELGYLLKESETTEDPVTLHKKIVYRFIPRQGLD